MTDEMKNHAEELGGKTVETMNVETHLSDPFICFFELRKKFPGSEDWGVLHVTVRDMEDDLGLRRVAGIVRQMTGQDMGSDWQLADTPKYGGGYGKSGGGNKPKRVAPPADGWFAVKSVSRKKTGQGKDFLIVRGEAPEGNYYEASAWDNIVDASPFPENWRDDEVFKEGGWVESKDPKHVMWVETTKVEKDGRTFYNAKGFKKTLAGERPD